MKSLSFLKPAGFDLAVINTGNLFYDGDALEDFVDVAEVVGVVGPGGSGHQLLALLHLVVDVDGGAHDSGLQQLDGGGEVRSLELEEPAHDGAENVLQTHLLERLHVQDVEVFRAP